MKSKRYICAMVVSVAIMLSGCGGSNNVQSSAEQGGLQPSQSEEQSPTAEPVRTVKAADVFDVVTGVSKEWQDGLYVINGKDSDGTMICGIMDKDQNVRIYEDYTALYPLADGHLIATQDTDMSGECYFEGIQVPIGFAGIHGVIIDANGNLIYEPKSDEYSRMYVINSHLILQLNAKMDFDGTEISAHVIDQNGEVLYEDEKIPHILSMYNCVKFSEDGKTWTLSQHEPRYLIGGDSQPLCFIQRGISDKYGESPLFSMEWVSPTGERAFHEYGLVSEDSLELNSVSFDEWLKHDGYIEFFDSQSFIDQRGQIISIDSNQSDGRKPDLSAVQQFIQDQKGNFRITYMGLIGEEDSQKAYFLVRPLQTLHAPNVIDEEKNVIKIPG